MTFPTLTLKPQGCNTHGVHLDGVKIAEFRFFRGWHKGRVYHSGWMVDLRDGSRQDLDAFAYFSDVKRELPWLLGLVA